MQIIWSGSGTLVAIVTEESFFVLRFDRAAYDEVVEEGGEITDEGVEDAFEVVAEVNEVYVFPFRLWGMDTDGTTA